MGHVYDGGIVIQGSRFENNSSSSMDRSNLS